MAEPYVCPQCGETDNWRAEYYQAVSQGVEVEMVDGEPRVVDYTGDEESFDDGSTDNDALRCESCGFRIELGTFVMLTDDELAVVEKMR